MASEYKPNFGIIPITASVTINEDAYAGKTCAFAAATGATVTLPAATGSGARYRFVIRTALSSGSYVVAAASGDIIQGAILIATDAGGVSAVSANDSNTFTMNGSTTGGVVGSWAEFEDTASGVWTVGAQLVSTGAEGTPFNDPA